MGNVLGTKRTRTRRSDPVTLQPVPNTARQRKSNVAGPPAPVRSWAVISPSPAKTAEPEAIVSVPAAGGGNGGRVDVDVRSAQCPEAENTSTAAPGTGVFVVDASLPGQPNACGDSAAPLPGVASENMTTSPNPIGFTRSHVDQQLHTMHQRLLVAEKRCRDLEERNTALEECAVAARASSQPSQRSEDKPSEHSQTLTLSPSQPCEDGSEQTVEAQNKIIAGLQAQLETASEELSSVREQFNRRLKKHRSASAELRTEASMTLMNLRQDNEELRVQNEQLKSEVQLLQRRCLATPTHNPQLAGGESVGEDMHAMLVAELSQQVADLSEELVKAKRKIRKLQRPPKHPSSAGAMLEGSSRLHAELESLS